MTDKSKSTAKGDKIPPRKKPDAEKPSSPRFWNDQPTKERPLG